MRGEVISVDGLSGDGLISGDDGARYAFTGSAVRGAGVKSGDRVDFVPLDGAATEVMGLATAPRPAASPGAGRGPTGERPYAFGFSMFAFEGRLRRSHFWINWLILLVFGFLVGLIPILGALVSLILIWPNLAIQVKRLHDMGRSGWWVTLPFGATIIGIIGAIAAVAIGAMANPDAFQNEDTTAMLTTMGPMFIGIASIVLVNIAFLLWIDIADSQPGANAHGANPKNPGQSAADAFS